MSGSSEDDRDPGRRGFPAFAASGPAAPAPGGPPATTSPGHVRDRRPDGAGERRPTPLRAHHRRRQDGRPLRRQRGPRGPAPSRAHRRGPGGRGPDVREHGLLRHGRTPLGAHPAPRRRRARLRADACSEPASVPEPRRLPLHAGPYRSALEFVLRARRPTRAERGPALRDHLRPNRERLGAPCHGRGAAGRADDRGMARGPRESGGVGRPRQLLRGPARRSPLAGQDLIRRVAHPSEGETLEVGPPARFSRSPAAVRRPAPLLGEHTRGSRKPGSIRPRSTACSEAGAPSRPDPRPAAHDPSFA